MKTVTPKIAILGTLDSMDNVQAEKVLEYIKSLLNNNSGKNQNYNRFKQEALREIRNALRKDGGFGLSV